MHVGLVIYGTLETVSGGYLYDRKLVEYLERQGDKVEIISIPWRNYAAHLTDNWNNQIYQKLKHFQGDILLQDELNHPSLFWLNRKLISNLQFPIISIVHHLRASEQHPTWLMPLYRAVERAYLKTVKGFVFNSQTTKQVVGQLLGQDVDRCVVAPPAGNRLDIRIGEGEIRSRALQPGPLRILFVGNVIERKGLHIVLEALAEVDFVWELAVAGDLRIASDYVAKLKNYIREKGFESRVKLHDGVSDEKLITLAKESHVFVMPSGYEGYGIAYLEGMGFGLPAIGTTAGAAGEIITDGKDGFLIPPGDSKVLTNRLRMLTENRGLLMEMGLNARKRYEAHPPWGESMASIREFLARLIKTNGVL